MILTDSKLKVCDPKLYINSMKNKKKNNYLSKKQWEKVVAICDKMNFLIISGDFIYKFNGQIVNKIGNGDSEFVDFYHQVENSNSRLYPAEYKHITSICSNMTKDEIKDVMSKFVLEQTKIISNQLDEIFSKKKK